MDSHNKRSNVMWCNGIHVCCETFTKERIKWCFKCLTLWTIKPPKLMANAFWLDIYIYIYIGTSVAKRPGASTGCGDRKEVTVSWRPDAEEARPVKCTNVLKVILYHIVIIWKVNYRVFVCVWGQLVVMPRGLFASPLQWQIVYCINIQCLWFSVSTVMLIIYNCRSR